MKNKLIPNWLVFATLAVAMALLQGCSAAAHYRAHQDGKSLYAALYKHVNPGDTPAQIEELLGPGKPEDQKKMVPVCRQRAVRFPESFPDSVQDDDTFLSYQCRSHADLVLQFRDGHLVNFVRDHFAKYQAPSGVAPR